MQAYRAAMLAALIGSSPIAACSDVRAQPPAPATSQALYLRFELPAKLQWGSVSVSLSPAAWRVGAVDGPPASQAQMRAVLGSLASVEIGGNCAGWVEGRTAYPCGFAVQQTALSGDTQQSHSVFSSNWEPSPAARQRRLPGTDRPEFRASGLIAPVLDEPRFASVRVSSRSLGENPSGAATFTFRIRAVSNALVPSVFERSSGTIVLRGGGADDAGTAQQHAKF